MNIRGFTEMRNSNSNSKFEYFQYSNIRNSNNETEFESNLMPTIYILLKIYASYVVGFCIEAKFASIRYTRYSLCLMFDTRYDSISILDTIHSTEHTYVVRTPTIYVRLQYVKQ